MSVVVAIEAEFLSENICCWKAPAWFDFFSPLRLGSFPAQSLQQLPYGELCRQLHDVKLHTPDERL